jgi:hypothetical protein
MSHRKMLELKVSFKSSIVMELGGEHKNEDWRIG